MCVCVCESTCVQACARWEKLLCAKGIRVYVAAVCVRASVCEGGLCVNSPATLYQDLCFKALVCVCNRACV